jgi:hypothetical protein
MERLACIMPKTWVMSKMVKISSWSNPLELWSDHFTRLALPARGGGGINKAPTVWLDGARP